MLNGQNYVDTSYSQITQQYAFFSSGNVSNSIRFDQRYVVLYLDILHLASLSKWITTLAGGGHAPTN